MILRFDKDLPYKRALYYVDDKAFNQTGALIKLQTKFNEYKFK